MQKNYILSLHCLFLLFSFPTFGMNCLKRFLQTNKYVVIIPDDVEDKFTAAIKSYNLADINYLLSRTPNQKLIELLLPKNGPKKSSLFILAKQYAATTPPAYTRRIMRGLLAGLTMSFALAYYITSVENVDNASARAKLYDYNKSLLKNHTCASLLNVSDSESTQCFNGINAWTSQKSNAFYSSVLYQATGITAFIVASGSLAQEITNVAYNVDGYYLQSQAKKIKNALKNATKSLQEGTI